MDKYVVKGGVALEGVVRVNGAKNSALKLMAASLMASEPCFIDNVPEIADVRTMRDLLVHMGLEVNHENHVMSISPSGRLRPEAPYEIVQKMRASIVVLGPLLARLGTARVAMPGGCNIGTRQIDLHLKGLSEMGAEISVFHGYIEARASKLKGARIYLDLPSVGATENLMMAACMAKGKTLIENAAMEPEITDLAEFLVKLGAKISGIGTPSLQIEGVDYLGGAEHTVIGDRIEAGTFLMAGAITRGSVEVKGFNPLHLDIVLEKMKEAGCAIEVGTDAVSVSVPDDITGIEISTLPYPGFPTDLQPQMVALLSTSRGISFVTENIYDNRFMVVDELNRLGARIKTRNHHAIIHGVPRLSGAPVTAMDLRAGAALVIAGLCAEGETVVHDIYHIDRGYECFEEKLKNLGAKIERMT